MLPACAAFEKSGTTTDLAGNIRPVVAGVPAPDAVLADGDMLVALADVLGRALVPGVLDRWSAMAADSVADYTWPRVMERFESVLLDRLGDSRA